MDKEKGNKKEKGKDKESGDSLNTEKEDNSFNTLGTTTKEVEYYGFMKTLTNNYGYTFLFVFLIIGLIFLIKYAQKRLNFPESKMIINWFGFIIIINVIITYGTIMMYKQVKNQKGYVGIKGVQGPVGDQGMNVYCSQCAEEVKTVQPLYGGPKIKSPFLPETIVIEPEDEEDDNEDDEREDNTGLGDEQD